MKAATTANITLSGTQTVDGVALIAGDACLVKDQSTASQNGAYVVAAGAWVRSIYMDAWAEVPGAYMFVEQGTANADTGWVCISDQGGTLGATAINFVKFTAASGVTSIASNTGAFSLAGGLTNSGNQIQIDGAFGFRNRLINPSGAIWQRANSGAAAVTDGTYAFDRWYGLTQTAGVTASQVANAEDGTPFMMRLSQANASAQRFGLAQVIESANCIDMRGQRVALSARVRMSAATTLRYAIVEWSGTADAPTKDFVLSWTNTTFTAGNFFTTTSTVVTATGSVALAANTLTSISLLAQLSSTGNNVAVMFWTDSAQAQNVTLDIGKVQLEQSISVTSLAYRSRSDEEALCKRYFYSGIPPARGLVATTSSVSRLGVNHPVSMLKAPTVAPPAGGGGLAITDGAVAVTISSITVNYSTAAAFEVDASTSPSTLTANRIAIVYQGGTNVVWVDAEIN